MKILGYAYPYVSLFSWSGWGSVVALLVSCKSASSHVSFLSNLACVCQQVQYGLQSHLARFTVAACAQVLIFASLTLKEKKVWRPDYPTDAPPPHLPSATGLCDAGLLPYVRSNNRSRINPLQPSRFVQFHGNTKIYHVLSSPKADSATCESNSCAHHYLCSLNKRSRRHTDQSLME